MLSTITLVISLLVLMNLILFKFTSNKTEEVNTNNSSDPILLKPHETETVLESNQNLAPTGS